jgi:gas vesicle protein
MDINSVWDAIAPYVTGTGIGAIIGGILFACLKGAFTKALNKIDVEKTTEKIIDKSLDKIQSVSFSQNIQPLVEDEMKKVVSAMNYYLASTIKSSENNYKALLEVMVALSKYFENGYGIPEEVKQNLAQAIEKAQEIAKEEQAITYSVKLDKNNVLVETKQEVKTNEVVR